MGEYMCLLFSPAHIAHTAHSTHSFLKEKIWMLSFFWPAHIAHTTHRILQEKIWMLPIIFTCTHCTHRTLYPHQTKPPTMTGIYVSIIFTCTHRTLYPQLLERKNKDALNLFGLHTLH